jgi:hypothetical protein
MFGQFQYVALGEYRRGEECLHNTCVVLWQMVWVQQHKETTQPQGSMPVRCAVSKEALVALLCLRSINTRLCDCREEEDNCGKHKIMEPKSEKPASS